MRVCFLSKPRLMEQRGPTRPSWSGTQAESPHSQEFREFETAEPPRTRFKDTGGAGTHTRQTQEPHKPTSKPTPPTDSRGTRARLFASSADTQPPVPVLAFALHRKKRDATYGFLRHTQQHIGQRGSHSTQRPCQRPGASREFESAAVDPASQSSSRSLHASRSRYVNYNLPCPFPSAQNFQNRTWKFLKFTNPARASSPNRLAHLHTSPVRSQNRGRSVGKLCSSWQPSRA
jgi:hypothetical protein